jgi:hypothetical protein
MHFSALPFSNHQSEQKKSTDSSRRLCAMDDFPTAAIQECHRLRRKALRRYALLRR